VFGSQFNVDAKLRRRRVADDSRAPIGTQHAVVDQVPQRVGIGDSARAAPGGYL